MASSSLNLSISGLKTSQESLDLIMKNLGNLKTSNLKASSVSFANEFTQALKPVLMRLGGLGGMSPISIGKDLSNKLAQSFKPPLTPLGGLGRISPTNIGKDFSQGTLTPTGRPPNLAFQDNGFFILRNAFENFYTGLSTLGLNKSNDPVDSSMKS